MAVVETEDCELEIEERLLALFDGAAGRRVSGGDGGEVRYDMRGIAGEDLDATFLALSFCRQAPGGALELPFRKLDPHQLHVYERCCEALGGGVGPELLGLAVSTWRALFRSPPQLALSDVVGRAAHVIIGDDVFDVSELIAVHPGKALPLDLAGTGADCAMEFEVNHRYNRAFVWLGRYFVGQVREADRGSVRRRTSPPGEAFATKLAQHTAWHQLAERRD